MAGFRAEDGNFALAVGLSVASGLATSVGGLAVFVDAISKQSQSRIRSTALALSAGVMLYVSFVEIFSKARLALQVEFEDGVALAIAIVDNALGEDAQVEEGVHAHSHPARAHEHAGELDKGTLHGSALLTTIAITLHNFPEGLATFIATLAEPSLGIALAVAIAVHNVPEGMAVAMPVYYASGSKWKGFMWATLSGLSEPIGGIVGWLMLRNSLTNTGFGVVFAIVGGMMVFIVIHEMVPLAVKYDQDQNRTTALIVIGMFVMAMSLVLFAV